MDRNQTIDIIRGCCMIYIVGIFHLSQYLGKSYYLNNNVYGNSIMWSCLGAFSLISGYLIGKKYNCNTFKDALVFYKRRVVRFYPLFFFASICLLIIGFNDPLQTFYALVGMAPFVSHKPLTLWYISMIMLFYLVSPIVLAQHGRRRFVRCMLVFSIFVICRLFIYIDLRFLFNLLVYLVGISAACINLNKAFGKSKYICGVLVLYALLFVNLNIMSHSIVRRFVDIVGVVVIVVLAKLIGNVVSNNNRIVFFLSYVSMSAYLFHRLTYWICLQILSPCSTMEMALFLMFIAFPVGLAFAYYVQKLYDHIVSHLA